MDRNKIMLVMLSLSGKSQLHVLVDRAFPAAHVAQDLYGDKLSQPFIGGNGFS